MRGIWVLDYELFGNVNITQCELLEDAIENMGDGSIPLQTACDCMLTVRHQGGEFSVCQFDAEESGEVVMYSQYVYCTDLVSAKESVCGYDDHDVFEQYYLSTFCPSAFDYENED